MATFDMNRRGGMTVNRESLHASPEYKRQIEALDKLRTPPMTPNLLDELEGVVAGVLAANSLDRALTANRKAADFLRTHAPALADMAKRMEAAERKLSRLTGMRNEWERDAREHLMTFGQHLPASVECLVERFDAAIGATQEGEAG